MNFDEGNDIITPNNTGTLTVGGALEVQGNADISSGNNLSLAGNNLVMQGTPTIASGFGTGASIVSNNGVVTFRINVGTTGSSSGVVNMPSAPNGWNIFPQIVNPASGLFGEITTITATSKTSFTIGNFSSLGLAANWPAGTIIMIIAFAY